MSKRKLEFYKNEYYHIFNRGVDKRKIFLEKGDLYYFFDAIQIANKKSVIKNTSGKNKRINEKKFAKNEEKLVDIISYCLLPNHFHFILKENITGGISNFMSKLGASYVGYFNSKYKRSGALFQGRFKAKKIEGEMGRELTSAYINLNYKHHDYDIKKDFIKTSMFEYLGEENKEKICDQEEIKNIINNTGGIGNYKKWLKNQSKYFIEKHGNDIEGINFDELEI